MRCFTEMEYMATKKEITRKIIECFRTGHKVLIMGNGGSSTMSSHMAAEFVGRFEHERQALPAISLATDTAVLTAWPNDYDFETVFS